MATRDQFKGDDQPKVSFVMLATSCISLQVVPW